jgi:hypothetical protein
MSIQSTLVPTPRLCTLLGGPRRPTHSVEPRPAALFQPAPRPFIANGRTQ